MQGQIELFSYLEESNQSLISSLAEKLIEYSKKWGRFPYDESIDRLMENPTEDAFIKRFCKITCTYFFEHKNEDAFYGAEFIKKEKIVQFHKCGKDYERILHECPIERVIKELQMIVKKE